MIIYLRHGITSHAKMEQNETSKLDINKYVIPNIYTTCPKYFQTKQGSPFSDGATLFDGGAFFHQLTKVVR